MENIEQKLSSLLTELQLEDSPAGGSLVVYHQGQQIANVSIGNATANDKWTADTLSLNFSTGKGVLVTLVHILVSQGLLDYDKSVADYWPEFSNNGKQHITLRDVLTHRAGLFNVQAITESASDMLNWQLMLGRVEKMSINSLHNEQAESAYSALVSGWVLGGLIEKVTGLALNAALEKYLAIPLGIEGSVYFGVPEEKVPQVATLSRNFTQHQNSLVDKNSMRLESQSTAKSSSKQGSKPRLRQDSQQTLETYRKLPSFSCWQKFAKEEGIGNESGYLKTLEIAKLYLDMMSINLQDFKQALSATGRAGLDYYSTEALMAKIPAANNVASASALTVMYAMLANKGQWQGKQLIREDVFAQLAKIYVTGSDAIMPAHAPNSMQWRLGYHRLFTRCQSMQNVAGAFGHMGYNGSVAWCDIERQLAVAYTHNFDVTMSTDIRQFAIIEAIVKWIDNL